MKKYEFHARASDIPLPIIDIFFRKGSYGDAELLCPFENGVLSLYWSEQGIKQASEIGEHMLDKDFFLGLIKKIAKLEKEIDKFSFSLKDKKLAKEWMAFDKLVFDYSRVYRFCEEPFFRSIEKRLLDNHDVDILNDIMHNADNIKNIKFSEEEKKIIHILRTIGEKKLSLHLKNEKIFADMDIFITNLSKKTRVPKDNLYHLKSHEIIALLKGKKVNFNSTNERKNGCVFFNGPNSDYICATGEIFLQLKDLVEPKIEEIKGFPASRGKAKGKVRVHLSWIKAVDFDKGDIIVTGMTNPQMFPYLQKAAAIVTDEGGIICHAAIVSRELGIPCIIGTKVATQILKDGDYVEVDANKGVVRKIK